MTRGVRQTTLEPRKTAVQARAAATLQAIIEAAARILEAHGAEGYTTNAIAERAGVSIGSLYQYFPNKDAITLALLQREGTMLLADLTRASEHEDWREAIGGMVDAAVRYQVDRPDLARLLDDAERRLPTPDPTSVDGTIHALTRQVLARAAKGVDTDLDQLTVDVLGMTRGMTDGAGRSGEADAAALSGRLRLAILGYITASLSAQG